MRHLRLERLGRPLCLALLAAAACSSGNKRSGPPSADAGARGGYLSGQAPDLNRVYQSMGLSRPLDRCRLWVVCRSCPVLWPTPRWC